VIKLSCTYARSTEREGRVLLRCRVDSSYQGKGGRFDKCGEGKIQLEYTMGVPNLPAREGKVRRR